MIFELSEELINQIMFALENQNNSFVLDSETLKLIDKSTIIFFDNDRYFYLPEWDSIDGFRMMERFVLLQKNTEIKQKLRSILFSGRGVFRNFKNVLKSFPEVEKQWYTFREHEMTQYILEWYNMLRDAWGLEKLGDEPEESEDLVHDDFIFRVYEEKTDKINIENIANLIKAERENEWPGEIGFALSKLWQRQYDLEKSGKSFSLIAETVDGEFVGYISIVFYPEQAQQTVLFTTFFVVQNYRGLGVGKELLSMILTELKNLGVRWGILSDMFIPSFLEPCLTRLGFVNCGGGYIIDLTV